LNVFIKKKDLEIIFKKALDKVKHSATSYTDPSTKLIWSRQLVKLIKHCNLGKETMNKIVKK